MRAAGNGAVDATGPARRIDHDTHPVRDGVDAGPGLGDDRLSGQAQHEGARTKGERRALDVDPARAGGGVHALAALADGTRRAVRVHLALLRPAHPPVATDGWVERARTLPAAPARVRAPEAVPRPGNPRRPPSRLYNRAPALGKEKASTTAGAAHPAKRCHERAARHEVDAHPLDPSASMRRRVG